jgi:non-lysosomal glucosylceramidase
VSGESRGRGRTRSKWPYISKWDAKFSPGSIGGGPGAVRGRYGGGTVAVQGKEGAIMASSPTLNLLHRQPLWPKQQSPVRNNLRSDPSQVMGQSWAFQVALPRVFPQKESLSALQSLWRYNFTPDVGPYRAVYKPGRWYAMPGEAGLLMCTFPRSDWDYDKAKGKGAEWAAGYFNECMNGFEYEVAGHMIWEGMVTEGLAVTRAVHDRYHPSRRNPWNEVECGDHYARSMASYGIFLAACGFVYHGPKGHLGFAPRVRPENFKAAFTAAEGWGTFSQQAGPAGLNGQVSVRWGKLRLRSLSVELLNGYAGGQVKVLANRHPVKCDQSTSGSRLTLAFDTWVELQAGQILEVTVV